MKKKHYIIYAIAIIISLIFIIFGSIYSSKLYLEILKNIGCSVLAACILSFVIEYFDYKDKERSDNTNRSKYLSELYNELIMLVERMLRFDVIFNDNKMNLTLPSSQYKTLNFMVASSMKYNDEKISFDEAIERLSLMKEKYSIDNFKKMSQSDQDKINKMFEVFYIGCDRLIKIINKIQNDKLLLDTINILKLDESISLISTLSMSIDFMRSKNGNKAIVFSFISVLKMLREKCNFDNDVNVGVHGGFEATEI